MPITVASRLPPAGPSLCRVPARAWAWLERLLILVLALDLAGSPLHAHRHDGQWSPVGVVEATAQAIDAVEIHLEDHDGRAFSHSIAAIRPLETEGVGGVDRDAGVATRHGPIANGLVATTTLAQGHPSPRTGIHRSLPPEGRAPPLHG